ncbi:MAG: hypothetical protein M1823_007302, partial [Watsoniomyces obsoletus]
DSDEVPSAKQHVLLQRLQMVEELEFVGHEVDETGHGCLICIADGALAIERLRVTRLGGASLDVAGQVRGSVEAPEGRLTVAAKADDLAGVARVLSAVDATRWLGEALDRRRLALAPLDLKASLDFARGAAGVGGNVVLSGSAGASAVSADTTLSGLATGAGRIDAKLSLENPSAVRLLGQLGLSTQPDSGLGQGRLQLTATGPIAGDIEVDGRIDGV